MRTVRWWKPVTTHGDTSVALGIEPTPGLAMIDGIPPNGLLVNYVGQRSGSAVPLSCTT